MISVFAALFVGYARIIVVGDSIAAPQDGWPQQMQTMYPAMNVHNYSQAGRRSRDYDFPRDLRCGASFPCTIVLAIGANDHREPALRIRYDITRLVKEARSLGGNPILLIPPNLDELVVVRKSMLFLAKKMGVEHINIDDIWDVNQTLDGLHPNSYLSMTMAGYIGKRLESM
jgi:hypothetical protein